MKMKKLLVEIDEYKKNMLVRSAKSQGTTVAFIVRRIIDAWAEEYSDISTQKIIARGFETSQSGDKSNRGTKDKPGVNCSSSLPWLDTKTGC